MGHEMMFRIVLAILVVVSYFPRFMHKRSLPKGDNQGGPMVILARLWAAIVLVYIMGFVSAARVALPEGARWMGAALILLCAVLSQWIHKTLGIHFSTGLKIRDFHQLIRSGPYHFVRHPMYVTFFLCALGVSLVSANFVVMSMSLIVALLFFARIEREEAMLLKYFGNEYKWYMDVTGMLVPKLRSFLFR
jgi:protein-S-isoprenylcysteine O-methyltransferase Ste14